MITNPAEPADVLTPLPHRVQANVVRPSGTRRTPRRLRRLRRGVRCLLARVRTVRADRPGWHQQPQYTGRQDRRRARRVARTELDTFRHF